MGAAIGRVANRARLGASIQDALEPLRSLPHGELIARSIAASVGADPCAAIDRLVASIETVERLGHEQRSAALPSKLSARLLGVLALAALAVTALAGVRPSAGPLVLAGVLAGAGTWWMARLRAGSHPAGGFASDVDALAALFASGVPIGGALEAVGGPEFEKPVRLARLGAGWARACEGRMRTLGRLLERMTRSGSVRARDLHALAEHIREADRRETELRMKRMPVMLVLPLCLCFLPAFVLMIGEPMLRAVAP